MYDWVVVKELLKSHIRQNSLFPNAQFSSSITDAMLHESDVVISQNATVCSFNCKQNIANFAGSFFTKS